MKKQMIVTHSPDLSMGQLRYTAVGVYIGDANGEGAGPYSVGVSLCAPQDMFCKKTGRNIAAGRAVKTPLTLVEDKVELKAEIEKILEMAKATLLNKQV